MQALTLADYQKVVGPEWLPRAGFKVVVRGEWQGVVTAVLKRTVVVRDPRIQREDENKSLCLKSDVAPRYPWHMRWVENRESQITISAISARRPPECITMAELRDRLGILRFRLCPCGEVAINRVGYPRCAECHRLGVNATERRQYWKNRAPRRCPCGAEPANSLGRPRCSACREAARKRHNEQHRVRDAARAARRRAEIAAA
jgi:hypothetical protein